MLRFKLHHLCALSLLVTALCQRPTQAMGLSFELAPRIETALAEQPSPVSLSPSSGESLSQPRFEPLPIPPAASQPPVRAMQSRLPSNVVASTRILTPPPAGSIPVARVLPPGSSPEPPQKAPIALSFTPDSSKAAAPPVQASLSKQSTLPSWIYQGGSDSLVARTIGRAEGTRAANGSPTRAYYGHTDPGNGVWNMGTFSYQHGANSPDEADQKQLRRLKRQGTTLAQQAEQAALTMSLGEILNALDLANQSPKAALEEGGYIDRLAQARQKGMKNGEAIIWARTYAYLDPHTRRWNAPGLGNTLPSIQRDQSRRHDAITQAFSHYHAQYNSQKQPPEKILAAVPVDVGPPAATPDKTERVDHKQETTNEPSQPIQLAFTVAASLPSSDPTQSDQTTDHQTVDHTPMTPAPRAMPEASQILPAFLDTPQANISPAVEPFEIPG